MREEINSKIDDALFNFYLEADKSTINDILRENIHDYEKYVKNKNKTLFLIKAMISQKRNEYLLQLASKFQEAVLLNIEKPIAILKQLVQDNPTFALYNNFEKFSKEDIIEIIKDKNLIDLLEQLDENEKRH